MFSAFFAFAALLLAIPYLASMVFADYIRFSITEIKSIEPREWNADELWTNLNLVTDTQNVTIQAKIGNWTRGAERNFSDAFKDITLMGNEPSLTLSLAVYNVGDDDPQELGLKITSIILQIPSRIPIVGGIAAALGAVIDLFKGAYKCEGPVALSVSQLSQQAIQSLPYNQARCKTEEYSYETQGGCANVYPTETKKTRYRVKQCVERRTGSSTATGGQRLPNGSSGQYAIFDFAKLLLVVGLLALYLGAHH